jgi:hypothetical protein
MSINEFSKMRRTQFNIKTKQFTSYKLTRIFDDFLKAKITKVTVEKTNTGGLFGGPRTTVVYQLDTAKKHFSSTYKTSGFHYDDTRWQELKNKFIYNRKRINPTKVDDFMQYLNQNPEKSLSWADFNDEHPDKKEALKQLIALKETEKPTRDTRKRKYFAYRYIDDDNPIFYPTIDTAFLKSIVDRENYPDSLLTEFFGYSRHLVKHTYRQMTIENENGETIEIRQDEDYRTPANLIWIIQTQKWEFRTADKAIAQFIYSLSPKTFVYRNYRAPWQVYLDIAEYLYPKRAIKE